VQELPPLQRGGKPVAVVWDLCAANARAALAALVPFARRFPRLMAAGPCASTFTSTADPSGARAIEGLLAAVLTAACPDERPDDGSDASLEARSVPPPPPPPPLAAAAASLEPTELVSLISRHKHLVVHCRKAPYDVYVGRDSGGRPSDAPAECVWGNPFSSIAAKREGVSDLAIRTARYLHWLLSQREYVARARAELRSKRLGCWCSPRYCHGWVLAAIANCSDAELQEVCAPCLQPSNEPPPALVQAAERLAAAEAGGAPASGGHPVPAPSPSSDGRKAGREGRARRRGGGSVLQSAQYAL